MCGAIITRLVLAEAGSDWKSEASNQCVESKDVRTQIQARDALALPVIEHYERGIPRIVDHLFGLSRGNFVGSHALEPEKLSLENCNQSCGFGDVSLTIKETVGG